MNIPCKVLLAAATIGFSSVGALAQDAYYGLSAFEGIYVGAYAGGLMSSTATNWTAGGIAGANFAITDGIVAGAEVQGGGTFGTTTTYDALMLGHLGYEISDQAMVYGAAGGGAINSTASYAVGVGAEFIAADQLGVRGEVLGTGAWGGGFTATKASAGVLWHVR